MPKQAVQVISVALNPCVDRALEVPNFTLGKHQQARQLFRRAAGKAINLAGVLEMLDVSTMVLGFVGKDQQDYFERSLEQRNITCQLFALDGRTRENVTIVDPINNLETHIRDQGFAVGPAELDKLKKKLKLVCRDEHIVAFSGSLPKGVSTQDLLELVQIPLLNGARVCIDSAGGVLRALAHLPLWLIKPNLSELSEMIDAKVESEDQIVSAAVKLGQTISLVLVTCGAQGGYLITDKQVYRGHVDFDAQEVKNTVGCGDAMLAGFIAAILKDKPLAEAHRYCLAVASSAAVSLAPGQVQIDDIKRFEKQAQLCQIDRQQTDI